MRLLVTGADGFIGSHIVRGLAQAGHDVLPVVYQRAAQAAERCVDLTDETQVAALPGSIDGVVHAAGIVDGTAGASFAKLSLVNVRATENLLRWARRHAVRHFVQISSTAVYGPRTLGEDRGEATPRLGRYLGTAYMRTKALAELAVEQSGVPYTLVRPPVVIGPGDTVLSRAFRAAIEGEGLPMLPGASLERRISLAFCDGLAELARRLLEVGPRHGAVHAVDVSVTLRELADAYARALGRPYALRPVPWIEGVRARNDAGISWLIASARLGQHYLSDRLNALGYRSPLSLDAAVRGALSGLPSAPHAAVSEAPSLDTGPLA